MEHPETAAARGHLRLAITPVRRPGRRLVRYLRAWLAAVTAFAVTLAAWFMALPAILPVLLRRAPTGRRHRQPRLREARVIPFQPRRSALPR